MIERFCRLGSYKFIHYKFILEMLLKKQIRNGDRILDTGCGKGNSINFPDDEIEIIGVDILRSNIEICKKRWKNRSYIVADITKLPCTKDSFTGVLSADVLEHVKNKNKVLNEMARVTQRDGFLIACSSNFLNPILWLDMKFNMLMKPLVLKFAASGHYDRHCRFSPTSLKKALNFSNYRLENLYLVGYPQFSQIKHISLGIKLLWLFFDNFTKKIPLLYFKEIILWHAILV